MERFSRDHQWVRVDGDVGTAGITDYARSQRGDVVSVERPEAGRRAAAGETVVVVESVRAASDVFTPGAGGVVEVNDERILHRKVARGGEGSPPPLSRSR